jgi:hypothetical protein
LEGSSITIENGKEPYHEILKKIEKSLENLGANIHT